MSLKTEIMAGLIFLIVLAICISFILIGAGTTEDTPELTTEPTTAETTEYITEPTETEAPTTEATEPAVTLYNVPLASGLQLHIIETAEAKGIDPAIVFAMAEKESNYNASAIGDGGDSYGLLQIQPYWHYGRMQELGCTDLLDPYQNVTVGVDYLCEMLSRYGSMEAALTAYNRGHYPGYVTEYATDVMAKAEVIRNAIFQ